jgi:hypothetical protein
MGASGWHYAVPYEDNVAAALFELRQRVFDERDFHIQDPDKMAALTDPDDALAAQPGTGTHSIIDMPGGVADEVTPFAVSPLTPEQVFEAFGTAMPTSTQIEEWADEHGGYSQYRDGWEGAWLVGYRADGTPETLHFVGASGD